MEREGLEVGVRYCGGCNPRYDRTALIKRLQAEFPALRFCTVEEGAICAIALRVCGCERACLKGEGSLLNGEPERLDAVRKKLRALLERSAE